MSIRSIQSIVLLKSSASLLVFCLVDLSSIESGVLKSPISVMLFLSSVLICALMLGIYIFIIVISSWWIYFFIIISFFVSCDSFLLKVYFTWYKYHPCSLLVTVCIECLYHPFILSLCIFLYLKWVSCRQFIVGSCSFFFNPLSHSMSFDYGI